MVRVEEFDSRDERERDRDREPSGAGEPDEPGAVADAIAAGTAVQSEAGAEAEAESSPSASGDRADDIPRPVTVEVVGNPSVTVEPASDDANPRADMDLEGADEDEPTGW